MTHFTSYAEQKFDLLNKHKVFFTREQIEEVLRAPDRHGRKGKYYWAQRDGIRVVFQREPSIIKVITFFPIK